jgi:phosphoglycolate phosphatase
LHTLKGGPCEGAVEFIEGIKTAKKPPLLGLLTGNIRLGAELKLRRYDLWKYFETGAFADDHEDRNCIAGVAHKRGEEILGRKLKGAEILVIGDTAHDIECGKSIGARTLAVATGGVKLDALKAHQPAWAVKDLSQINVAQALA